MHVVPGNPAQSVQQHGMEGMQCCPCLQPHWPSVGQAPGDGLSGGGRVCSSGLLMKAVGRLERSKLLWDSVSTQCGCVGSTLNSYASLALRFAVVFGVLLNLLCVECIAEPGYTAMTGSWPLPGCKSSRMDGTDLY